ISCIEKFTNQTDESFIGNPFFQCIYQVFMIDIVEEYAQSFNKGEKRSKTKVEIRCQLIREGNYQDTKFYIRMFQPDGVGQLKMDDGRILQPNDLYPLTKEVFRLYYTSLSSDQSVIDVYIEDSFGQVVQKAFSFQNENDKELNE
ncbi:hypothetical protein EZS27_031420, partial [termite gut metagenome]